MRWQHFNFSLKCCSLKGIRVDYGTHKMLIKILMIVKRLIDSDDKVFCQFSVSK